MSIFCNKPVTQNWKQHSTYDLTVHEYLFLVGILPFYFILFYSFFPQEDNNILLYNWEDQGLTPFLEVSHLKQTQQETHLAIQTNSR